MKTPEQEAEEAAAKAAADSVLSGEGTPKPEATPAEEATPPAKPKVEATPADDDKPFKMSKRAWREQVTAKQAEATAQLAKDLGYDSVDAMKTALARSAARPATATPAAPAKVQPAEAAPAPGETPEQKALLAPMRDKLRKEIAAGRQFQAEARKAREEIDGLKLEFEAKQADSELREAARTAGIVGENVKFAMLLLREKLDGMDADEIATFNEDEWFCSLKEKYPVWFGVVERPANAGHADREQPKKPTAAESTKRAGEANAFDAMKATKAQIEERLASLNIPRPRLN